MFCYILGKAAVDEFFIQDLHLNSHSFLGFQHGNGSSVKAITISNITISDWFEMFLFSNSIIVIPKVNHTWVIFPHSKRSLLTKLVFKRILTKAFCQYILNLMSKKKLGSFNDLINAYFQSLICLPRYEHFLASIFCKVFLELFNQIQPILERLKANITKPWKPSVIDRSNLC